MTGRSRLRRPAALLLLPLLVAGCLSVRTSRAPAEGETGGVSVQVFADDDARRDGVPGPRHVVGELERRVDGTWRPVFKAMGPTWTVVDLPPGKYRVRFPAYLDEAGNALATADPGAEAFRVRAGEVTEVEATLDHFPTGLVVAGVVTAVVAAVLLDDWLEDHDLPTPPLPHEVLDDVFFHLTFHAVFFDPGPPGVPDPPPVVTSHFPEEGALVAAKRVRVVFALSEPLDPDEVAPGAVTLVAERAGRVAGRTSYDRASWWVVWEAEEDLPRDDLLHATLGAGGVEDLAGNELPEPVTFTFRTTP